MIPDIPDTATATVEISVDSLALALFIETVTNAYLPCTPEQIRVVRFLWDEVSVQTRQGYRDRARRVLERLP